MSEWKIQNYGPFYFKSFKNENYDELLNHLVPLTRVKRAKSQSHKNKKGKQEKEKLIQIRQKIKKEEVKEVEVEKEPT